MANHLSLQFGSEREREDALLVGARQFEMRGGNKMVPLMSHTTANLVRTSVERDDPDSFTVLVHQLPFSAAYKKTLMEEKQLLIFKDQDGAERIQIQPRVPGLTAAPINVAVTRLRGERPRCPVDVNVFVEHGLTCQGLHHGQYQWPEDGPARPEGPFVVITDEERMVKKKEKRLTYQLVQVLTDSDIKVKYKMTEAQLQLVRRRAVDNPDAACKLAKDLMVEQGYTNVTVVPGRLAATKKASLWRLKQAAGEVELQGEAVDLRCIHGKLVAYHGLKQWYRVMTPAGPIGDPIAEWAVDGPQSQAEAVVAWYWLCRVLGPQHTVLLYAYEAAVLGLVTVGADGHPMLAGIRLHAASDSRGLDALPVDLSALSDRERSASPSSAVAHSVAGLSIQDKLAYAAYASAILPVRHSERGGVVGSAVWLDGSQVLTPEHVLPVAGPMYVGTNLAAPLQSLAHDLWVVQLESGSPSSFDVPTVGRRWLLRDVVQVGEEAVMVYNNGDEIEVSEALRVVQADRGVILTTLSQLARPGCSGAALVAKRDKALLGVYRGASGANCVFTALGDKVRERAFELQAATSEARESASDVGDTLYSQMKRRGLGAVVNAAIKSLEPLYCEGKHVGVAVGRADVSYTALDVDSFSADLVGSDGTPRAWVETDVRGVAKASPRMGEPAGGVMLSRRVAPREKVFIMSRDRHGPYFSPVVQVSRVYLANSFALPMVDKSGGLVLEGGLVMAVRDGAVVGLYNGNTVSSMLGTVGECYGLPELLPSTGVSASTFIGEKFHRLHPQAWPAADVDAAFEHASFRQGDHMRRFAFVGDAAMKLAYATVAMENDVPYAEWTTRMSKLQRNSVLAKKAYALGFQDVLRAGKGVSLGPDSKVYADALEALLGLVWQHETWSVFKDTCLDLGLLDEDFVPDPGPGGSVTPGTESLQFDVG